MDKTTLVRARGRGGNTGEYQHLPLSAAAPCGRVWISISWRPSVVLSHSSCQNRTAQHPPGSGFILERGTPLGRGGGARGVGWGFCFGLIWRRDWIACALQTWRRPTFPRLETKYHRRWGVSRPSSEWDRVRPPRNDHQVGEAQAMEKLGRRDRVFSFSRGAPEPSCGYTCTVQMPHPSASPKAKHRQERHRASRRRHTPDKGHTAVSGRPAAAPCGALAEVADATAGA